MKNFLSFISNFITPFTNNGYLINRIKYFSPTIHQGIIFTTVSWTKRDFPLTDEEASKEYQLYYG